MDPKTIYKYILDAQKYSEEYDEYVPENIYKLINLFFKKDGLSADIGCGSGRDADFINNLGYTITGYDASASMLNEATKRYGSNISFLESALPELEKIDSNSYDNLLCSAVLMHIPDGEIIHACRNLMRVLRDDGIMILSFRSSRSQSEREDDERLFTWISAERLILLFEGFGGSTIYQTKDSDHRRPQIEWITLVIRKRTGYSQSGIFSIQKILSEEKKTATYKFALVRALCDISQNEPELCKWDKNGKFIWVPVSRVAVRWLQYYWKFVKSPEYYDLKQTSANSLAMATHLGKINLDYHDLPVDIDLIQDNKVQQVVREVIKNISKTIIGQPVKYAGGGDYCLLAQPSRTPDEIKTKGETYFGVPVVVWRDISLFTHWIEESISVRWAEQIVAFTCKKNVDDTQVFARAMGALRKRNFDKRDTSEIKKILQKPNVKCLWTRTEETDFEIDHIIPYSILGNNDFWNMMPSGVNENRNKTDRIPDSKILEQNKSIMVYYWQHYNEKLNPVFSFQLNRFFGIDTKDNDWENKTFRNLAVRCERLINLRGLRTWP